MSEKTKATKLLARLRGQYRREHVRHEKAALQYGVVCGTRRTTDTVIARAGERVTCLRCIASTKREVSP